MALKDDESFPGKSISAERKEEKDAPQSLSKADKRNMERENGPPRKDQLENKEKRKSTY